MDSTLCWRWVFKILGIAGCVLLPFLFWTLYGSDNRKPTRGSEGANTVKGQESQDLIWRKKKQLTLKVRIKFRCTCTASQDPYPSPHPSSWYMHTSIKSEHRMKRGLRMILSIMQYIGMKLGWLFGIYLRQSVWWAYKAYISAKLLEYSLKRPITVHVECTGLTSNMTRIDACCEVQL